MPRTAEMIMEPASTSAPSTNSAITPRLSHSALRRPGSGTMRPQFWQANTSCCSSSPHFGQTVGRLVRVPATRRCSAPIRHLHGDVLDRLARLQQNLMRYAGGNHEKIARTEPARLAADNRAAALLARAGFGRAVDA